MDSARDEREVLGYYRSLEELEKLAKGKSKSKITEAVIKNLHAYVMAGRNNKINPTPDRDGQNVIRGSRSGKIVYLPPEARDVSALMGDLVSWLSVSEREGLPCPLRSAIAHYQFATIHPYYDGDGRTARLLATLILHSGAYDLKGFYSLEEYYARDLGKYYEALSVGPSHNFYMGQAEADISGWIEYFCAGMSASFKAVERRVKEAAQSGKEDHSKILRSLDVRQRKALSLFEDTDEITSFQFGELFGIQPRTARDLCQKWVSDGFLAVTGASKKARKYALTNKYARLASGRQNRS